MAWQANHKQESKDKILSCAGALFTRFGFANVAIDDVMQAAGMTRGAFYHHFKSKAELYQQSLLVAARDTSHRLLPQQPEQVMDIVERYLSLEHINSDLTRCPLAFLVTDIGIQHTDLKHTYSHAFQGFCERIQNLAPFPSAKQAQTVAILMVGTAAIARACGDGILQQQLLANAQVSIRQQLTLHTTE